ncbi:prolyl oligopeptidase family serine peptidase [Flagellimonas sp. DF-77]|uniref:alpha/beta hydrolase family protein n=1 Tax=Flagellimonas algarum TaxID=3230298 RepID=UPI00339AFAAC
MKTRQLFLIFVCIPFLSLAQKKVLDHSDYDRWRTIEGEAVSPNGSYVLYSLEQGEKDHSLSVLDTKANVILRYPRGQKGQFSYDSNYAIFTIKAWKDSVDAMKRRKVKKKDLPKDSLGILNLKDGSLTKIGNIKSYRLPEEWSGYLAYQLEEIKKKAKAKENGKAQDSVAKEESAKKKKKAKKVGKKTGYHLVLHDLETQNEDTIPFVTDFTFAKKGKWLAYITTGTVLDSLTEVKVRNMETGATTTVHSGRKTKYHQLKFSATGTKLGFISDSDTTKVQLRPYELHLWQEEGSTTKLLDNPSAPKGYVVSKNGTVHFSEDESKLYFGLATPPIEKDTALLDDEIVNVEVWTYDEPRLYTVQELQLKNDSIRAYTSVYDLSEQKIVPLANADYYETDLGDKGDAELALIRNGMPYALSSQWTARRYYDYQVIDVKTGASLHEFKKAPRMQLSPKGRYAFGYSRIDSTWFTYGMRSGDYHALSKGIVGYSEENDYPNYPYPYGVAGWTKEDGHLLIYDRYDIWKIQPETGQKERLTNGRPSKTVYRYLDLDPEEKAIDLEQPVLLSSFNETTKNGGYVALNASNGKMTTLVTAPYRFSRPIKAKLADRVMFTKQSFETFPDLYLSTLDFKRPIQVSDANPQQEEYNWGTMELVDWISLDGKKLQGMLVKPQDFDPNKKYPLLVNFYEKSSDGVHRHRHPRAERSTINYSLYASKGYVIFNPDVHYRIGYPGESAYNCVIPGITSLLEKGYIDRERIGVQGHSWGGYQIAYLVTRTDIFKAAESGAPVPNMISAYGGIRWWTGLSRQFQYEHTQSRIGGTPWEYPQRYIENSPIFNIDKINTPLLIMHNDADGHVPWYQGIEFFVSLRRLGKPSWFLNYNGEPHWPLKLQNRKDFSIRMAQYFDHYLKGAGKPSWMDRGLPPIEKGILKGYELLDE